MSTSVGSTYTGCKGFDEKDPIRHLTVGKTTAKKFFKSHVATRTPAVFDDQIHDAVCSTSELNMWSNTYLRLKCGPCKIKVETRAEGGSFGKGNEIKTTFGEFLATAPEGRSYLTTQDLVYDEDGRPAIVSPPLTLLTEDYPLTPALFSNLIVSNINMWFGYTKHYSTSGLHHDFHDNIYILLRGEKRFTLVSPCEAANLYTVGTISNVHPNGRINYVGQLPTRADGSDPRADLALEAAARLQAVAERLAQAPGRGSSDKEGGTGGGSIGGGGDEDSDLEDELDAALEQVLDAEMEDDDYEGSEEEDEGSNENSEGEGEGSGEDGSDVDWNGQDDYVDSDADNADNNNSSEEGEEGSEEGSDDDEESEEEGSDEEHSGAFSDAQGSDEEDAIAAAVGASLLAASGLSNSKNKDKDNNKDKGSSEGSSKRPRADLGLLGKGLLAALQASKQDNKSNKNKKQRTDTAHTEPATSSGSGGAKATKSTTTKTPVSTLPDNFSQVDTDLSDAELRAKFPLFADLKARGGVVDVVLKAGQMLYIPAGWFHEVRSRGTVESGVDGVDESEFGGHLALNYWFHPPDGASFEKPYTSDFWKKDFEDRMKK